MNQYAHHKDLQDLQDELFAARKRITVLESDLADLYARIEKLEEG